MSKAPAAPIQPLRLPMAKLAAYAVLGTAVLSLGLSIGAAQLGASLRHAGATVDEAAIDLRIGQQRFDIPANAIRFPEQRTARPQGEVDLYLEWPGMSGFTEETAHLFHDPDARSLLFVQLTATGAASPSLEEPGGAGGGAATPFGLLRSSRPGLPGIASQEAVYRAAAGREPAYEARCLDGPDAIMAADCMREVQFVPGLRLRYRFSHALLPQWDRIDRAVLAYLAQHRRP